MITMKDFAAKYGVPYRIVVDASFDLPGYDGRTRMPGREYEEAELLACFRAIAERRLAYHERCAQSLREMLGRIG